MFARDTKEPLASLVQGLSKFVDQNEDLCTFVVVLQDKATAEPRLKELAAKHGEAVPLTVPDGGAEPKSLDPYRLNAKVPYTVLVYNKKKVEANFALQKIGDDEVKQILDAAAKIVP